MWRWCGAMAYADVCSRMLTYAGVCGRMQATHVAMVRGDGTVTITDREVPHPLLTYAHVCSRMLTYAHVWCGAMAL
jgi:hypothetical protein